MQKADYLPKMERDWGDPDYDVVDYLIDNDPIELGRLYRAALRHIEQTHT